MSDHVSRPPRLLLLAAAALGAALGLASEQSATGFADPATWVPDFTVGWTFIVCGLIAWNLRPSSRSGLLMVATGCAWFLPNFSLVSLTAVAWVGDRTLYLYRGPLIHLLLTFPTGRATSGLMRVGVAIGYGTALTTIWQNDPASIFLALLPVVVGFVEYRRSLGRTRRARLVALRALALATLVLAGGAIARIVVPNERAIDPSHLVFEISLCALAIGLLVTLLTAPWERSVVTDIVVEMGEARSDGLRDELSRALGDPSLQIGYRLPGADGLVDARGRPLVSPEPGSDRTVTTVRAGDQEIAVLVHDRAVLDDPGLRQAVTAAAQLAASNARLQAEVRARVEELAASRRRLLKAGDEERRRLERRLHDGAERRLEGIATAVEGARAKAGESEPGKQLDAAVAQLRQTLEDLGRLGRGLHPRELTELGLKGALDALAARAPLPVSVSVHLSDLPPPVEAAAYYFCVEALTNVAKHAGATFASVSITSSDGNITVDVTDDGVGGANEAGGSGLRGMTDRIETLGGSISIDSPVDKGTHLVARIPLHPIGTT